MKYLVILISLMTLCVGSAFTQEFKITDFPIGIGGSVDKEFFTPYITKLKAVADTLQKYPLSSVVVTGAADGERYRKSNDAKNPSLALGRALALRSLLINQLGVDSSQIVIQTEEIKIKGPLYRYVSVRVDRVMSKLEKRVETIEQAPPVEKYFTEVNEITNNILTDSIGLQVGAGLTTSPFGAIPVIDGSINWKERFYFELNLGHSFWNSSYEFENKELDTKRRLFGGQIIVFPFKDNRLGIVGGWVRIEELSQAFYEYVRLSEGPVMGLRYRPVDFLSIDGLYNPAKQKIAGELLSSSKNSQFLLTVTAHLEIGGSK